MANPPITVGELTDVPAPQSPVNAAFHQEVAHRIVHRFDSVSAMNAWAAGNGSVAFVTASGQHYVRRSGAWVALVFAGQANSITPGMLANGAVDTTAKLADSIVTSAKVVDRSLVAGDLAVAVLEAAWVNVDMTGTNWTGAWSQVKKIGNIVWYRMQATANGAGTTVATIPVGYRPLGTVYVPAANISGQHAHGISITAAGAAVLSAITTIGHVYVASGHWESTP